MEKTIKIPARVLTEIFSNGNKNELGALAIWLLLKANYGDSKLHDFTLNSFCKAYHIGKVLAKRYIEAGEEIGLLKEVIRQTERKDVYKLGRKRGREFTRKGWEKYNKKGFVIHDLIAVRKKYAGEFTKFSTVQNSKEIGGRTIYIPTEITDIASLLEDNTDHQSVSQIIDLLKTAYVIFSNGAYLKPKGEGSTNTPVRKVDLSKFNSESAKSTSVCGNRGFELYEKLTMGAIFKQNVGATCRDILCNLGSSFFTESSLRRILKIAQGLGLIWCNKNYLLVRDFSEYKMENKPSEKRSVTPHKKGASAFDIIADAMKENEEYELQRVETYCKKIDKLEVYLLNGQTINLCENKIGWFGKSESDSNKFYVRLANNYISCCHITGTTIKPSYMMKKYHTLSETPSGGKASALGNGSKSHKENKKGVKEEKKGLDDIPRIFA